MPTMTNKKTELRVERDQEIDSCEKGKAIHAAFIHSFIHLSPSLQHGLTMPSGPALCWGNSRESGPAPALGSSRWAAGTGVKALRDMRMCLGQWHWGVGTQSGSSWPQPG